uniref:AKNA domain-containing protein n=1 Tax=Latimeria chalumnae TaxID=7897 RepID=H3B1J3_LATCH
VNRDNTPGETTDDELDDLPYDGDLENKVSEKVFNLDKCKIPINSHENLSDNFFGFIENELPSFETNKSPETAIPLDTQKVYKEENTSQPAMPERRKKETTFKVPAGEANNTEGSKSNIADVLLRHLSVEDLVFNSSRYIDSETMPETSFTESTEETVMTKTSVSRDSNNLLNTISDGNYSENFPVMKKTVDCKTDSEKQGAIEQGETILTSQEEESSDLADQNLIEVTSMSKFQLGRMGASNEIKYGQGQVHYPLPDFSKVAPKIKVPRTNDTATTVKSAPRIKKAKSSPNLFALSTTLRKTAVEVVQEIERRQQESRQKSELVQHLQVASLFIYKIFATFYQNQMSLIKNTQSLTVSESFGNASSLRESVGEKVSRDTFPQTSHTSSNIRSFWEQLTFEGRGNVFNFYSKVLKNLKESLDKLERNYIASKEEHRKLQLQNYNGKSVTIGEFDPDREVEGKIFRLGMQLEDIKEKIDENVRNQPSLQPLAMTVSLSANEPILSFHNQLAEV